MIGRERRDQSSRASVPDIPLAALISRDNDSIRRNGEAVDPAGRVMPFKSLQGGERVAVKDRNAVPSRCGEEIRTKASGDPLHTVRMDVEFGTKLAAVDFPYPDLSLVITAGKTPVWQERDRLGGHCESSLDLKAGKIQHVNGRPERRRDQATIGRNRDGMDLVSSLLKPVNWHAAVAVPHDQCSVPTARHQQRSIRRKRKRANVARMSTENRPLCTPQMNFGRTKGADPREAGLSLFLLLAPIVEQDAEFRPVMFPKWTRDFRFPVVFLHSVCVIPPATVPKALKQPLRVILTDPIDEMDVAAEGLVQQAQYPAGGPVGRQGLNGLREVSGQIEQ